jgi:hypothetical protein
MLSTKNMIRFGILGISLVAATILVISSQNVFSTGCPTDFVGEHIKNAKTALESGNTEEAMSQLQQAEEAIADVSEE